MNDKNSILSALRFLVVSAMDRASWIAVGMALKEEGFSCDVWDDWSRNDDRYHPGECAKKWDGFNGSGKHVTGATIIQMAKDKGWTLFGEDGCMDWNDEIEYDGTDGFTGFSPAWNQTEDLINYLEALFDPDDIVGYVTNDAWQADDGRWVPSKGVYDRTAGELIASLKKHPEDIGMTIGDCKPDAGGWIRFNPLDGQGVKNENVAKFKYALVESDDLSVQEQDVLFRKMELPIVAMVSSGNKSVHAIVHIDAADYEEYRKRVEFLYDFLEKQGVKVDKQNRNPSRLSRIPGVYRGGNRQYLICTNIGRKSWADWMDYAEGIADEMPDLDCFADVADNLPPLPEELIEGILRRGHKMLISGSSKAGKSFLLIELAIAIAEGRDWLGFPCKKGRVLYVNLEIDPASFMHRIAAIYEALKMKPKHAKDLMFWNLRGHALPMDQLVPKLTRKMRDQHFDAVIIDPIYKVITGDENNASEMGHFCNQFDKIATDTGCSVIYCHHHSKGAQGFKKAMDRASGSGVFARDPDAQLDMIELVLTEDVKNNVRDGDSTAWRLESSLREFANIKPVNFWFKYPIHVLDESGELAKLGAEGSSEAGRAMNSRSKTAEKAAEEFRLAFDAENMDGTGVTVSDMMRHLNISDKTVYARIKKLNDEFVLKDHKIVKIDTEENTDDSVN